MARCIIFNPAAGRGLARRRINQLRGLANADDVFRATEAPGHAEELASQAAREGFDTIIAAGGDGTVHEAANGVLRSENAAVSFAPWPIGSANDYAFALGLPPDWPLRKDVMVRPRRVDAGEVIAGSRRRYFVNGLGLGFNAAVTLESRGIPRLRGLALYSLAFVRAIARRYRFFELEITRDGKKESRRTLALTINLGPREGGFLVTPRASLDDGLFDYVEAGPLSRWRALTLLPKLASGTLPRDHPLIRQGTCRNVEVQSQEPLAIHLDGEIFSIQSNDIRHLQVNILPAALTVLSCAAV